MSTTTLLPPIDEPKNIEKASVAVLLPTYCEAENIESLIQDIKGLNLNILIAVIDDSSPDGTAERVMKLQEKYGNIHLVSRSEKLGLGTAITEGFMCILGLKETPDYIITMDADYSHNPQDIPRLVNAAQKGCDLVIGSRYVEGGNVIGSRVWRRLVSRVANVIAAVTVSAGLHDCTSGFRCYSKNYVKDVLQDLHSQTYEIQIETLKQARVKRFRVKEIPITFVDRKKGRSKLTTTEVQAFLTYIMKTSFERLISLLKLSKT